MASYLLGIDSLCCTTCRSSPCDPCTCCLYPCPFTAAGGPALYPATDLPDTLSVKPTPAFTYVTVNYNGDYTYSDPAGVVQVVVDYNVFAWNVLNNDLETADSGDSPCLIGLYNQGEDGDSGAAAYDLFEDTYTVDGAATVTRTSPCVWSGGGYTLDYGQSSAYKWSLNGTAKSAPQSSPVGSYGRHTVS